MCHWDNTRLTFAGCSQGKLVYGNYGRPEDLDAVQKENVGLTGSVLLLRAGKISFAEQVPVLAEAVCVSVCVYVYIKPFNVISKSWCSYFSPGGSCCFEWCLCCSNLP